MSIELTLLQYVERMSGCAKKLAFPVPKSCDSVSQLFGVVAEYHLITWCVILFFFLMLANLIAAVKK